MTECSRPKCSLKACHRGLCKQHYEAFRRARVSRGWITGYTDATEAREHIVKLRACGIGHRRLAEMAGLNRRQVQRIPHQKRIHIMRARKILAVPIPSVPHVPASDGAYVPILGTRRRLQSLCALGYTYRELASFTGIEERSLWRIIERNRVITAALARRIDEVFRRLECTEGKSLKAKRRAERRGWPTPLSWDLDRIDDPSAEPCSGGQEKKLTFGQRYAELKELGLTQKEIAIRWDMPVSSLNDQLRRRGLAA